MHPQVPVEEIERAIDNFQTKVAGVVGLAPAPGRAEAAKKVLAEALALARAEEVGLDTMKAMILEEYGKPFPKADERAGTLVFNLLVWASTAQISLAKVGRWQAARIFEKTSTTM